MKVEISEEQLTCGILELAYMKMIATKTGVEEDYKRIFFREWIISENYEQKMGILLEALDKEINICDTDKYKEETRGKIY